MTTVGVIGAGAMGMGVVRSLRRAGFATLVRDVRAEAERDAARLGAAIAADAAAVAAACDIAVVLVVDAAQVDDVLFGPAGHAAGARDGAIVVLSSTLAPDFVAALAPRLAARGVADVIGASSGASWILSDRAPRALAGDFSPRAAAKILAKDVGIAADFAARLGADATFARAAQAAFAAAVEAGDGDADDAVLLRS